ncbi:unnamed protein product [Urochloa humidicola]
MSSSEAGAQGHGAPVPVSEPGALLPLVDKMVMSSSETSEKTHAAPVLVPVPQAPVAGADDKSSRHARLRRPKVEPKRARPVSDVSSGSLSGGSSAKVAPEPQQGVAVADAAAAVAAVWPKSLSHGAQSVIGRRRSMEEVVAIAAPLPVAAGEVEEGNGGGWVPEFFAVYDGHGGAWVAEACRDRLHVALAEEMARLGLVNGGGGGALWREAMAAAFARVDGEVSAVQAAAGDTKPYAEGSSVLVAVLEPRRIVVAHCGDSRAVLCRSGVPVPLSTEHKPERPDEMARIESVGGQILYWHGPRVLGVLSMSRSIGDYFLKPSMSAEPEVTVTDRADTDEFIILGSDGLWNATSNEYACKVTRHCLSGRLAAANFPSTVRGSSASDAAALLVEMAMASGSEDNVSAVVVELSRLAWMKKAACQNGRM